ncbi:outer membrane lipoprotein carrier protein LolA [Desulforhopalus sp. IMCC35007]|nr:outer membrane lipoprotein carrier protein LolA [Desulforhopalus sp. IMCC35007]
MTKQFFHFFSSVILCCCFMALSGHLVQASDTEFPEDIAKRLQQRYDSMKSITFNFNQNTRGEITGKPKTGSGTAAFLKGNSKSKMRWDYLAPKRQVLLSDGLHFFMYFEELRQMIISPASSLEKDLTYSFFSGKAQLQNDFYIRPADTELAGEENSTTNIIKLIPIVPHSQVQDIHLWVSKDSLIHRIHIQDHFGTITVLNLSNIHTDGLEGKGQAEIDTLFSFTPPEGTEIIQQ